MKSLITLFIISCTTAVSVFAQTSYNTVTINYSGQNKHVIIDGKVYSPSTNQYDDVNTGNNGNTYAVIASDLAPGRHTLQVTRNNNRRSTETTFNLRNHYDLQITVANNGSIQLQETFKRNNTVTGVGTTNVPMTNTNYNSLMQNIRSRTSTAARFNIVNQAFSNTGNFFTTSQARKLIQMVNGESFRLQLAKSSVRSITDPRNIYNLNSLLASQASRNELSEYISQSNGDQTSTGTTTTPNYGGAMSEGNFSDLINDIRNRWQTGAKLTAVNNAFATTNNYFTTTQVIQLIQQLGTESERLQGAKNSYRKIVDPANFSQVYALFGTQASRDDLAYYVRSIGGNAGTYETVPTVKTPMTADNYNAMLEEIRVQWFPGAKKRAVLTAFANPNNYFTTYQASQLIMLDNDEPDRMDMAKSSIRSITDPENIVTLYNIFPSQARRDELAAYVRTYNASIGQ